MIDLDATVNAAVAGAFHDDGFDWHPAGGTAVDGLFGDFRREPVSVGGGEGAEVTSRVPMLGVRLSDLPDGAAPREDDEIRNLAGSDWRIVRAELNGEGMAWLYLHGPL